MKNSQNQILLNKPDKIRAKNILLIGPNTKESIFDSRWVTAHQGSHWWASRLNKYGHSAATYDMNLKPGEDSNKSNQYHIELDDLLKKGMPGWEESIRRSPQEDGSIIWHPFTDLLDLFTERGFLINDSFLKWRPWDIIGFSILDATIEYDIAKIIKAKQLAPHALLIGGGSQATLNYQTLFDKSPLDIVVLGQDPYALLRIANEESINLFNPKSVSGIVFRNHSKIITAEEWTTWIEELDFKSMHQDLYWKKTACLYDNPQFQDINTFRLFMHNFCPVNCAFCTLTSQQRIATGVPTKAIGMKGIDIVKTIKKVITDYPQTHQIFFCDDDFMLTSLWANGFCDEMIKAKNDGLIPKDLGFICLTNINRLDKNIINKCKETGFRVFSIGVESVSQWKLNSMNKPQTPDLIWKVTQEILDSGIKPYYTLLLFTPFERIEDMIIDINGFRRMSRMGVGLSIEPYLMPLHGTIFYEADVPQRYKVISIEGSKETIKKGSAWIPIKQDSYSVFKEFEKWFPRFKKWRYESDKSIKHKEKNYYSHTILDAQEFVLKKFFNSFLIKLETEGILIDTPTFKTNEEIENIYNILSQMDNYDVDSVGALVKRSTVSTLIDFDFSKGRQDIRALQRSIAIKAREEEIITSVNNDETLKSKNKKQESFH